jgi:hypothetical protein
MSALNVKADFGLAKVSPDALVGGGGRIHGALLHRGLKVEIHAPLPLDVVLEVERRRLGRLTELQLALVGIERGKGLELAKVDL